MLFFLAGSCNLFRWDHDEEVDDDELEKIAKWTPAVKDGALTRVTDKTLRRLPSLLLEKEPADRPDNWDDVIKLLDPTNTDMAKALALRSSS